jgi:hypothetical protein
MTDIYEKLEQLLAQYEQDVEKLSKLNEEADKLKASIDSRVTYIELCKAAVEKARVAEDAMQAARKAMSSAVSPDELELILDENRGAMSDDAYKNICRFAGIEAKLYKAEQENPQEPKKTEAA